MADVESRARPADPRRCATTAGIITTSRLTSGELLKIGTGFSSHGAITARGTVFRLTTPLRQFMGRSARRITTDQLTLPHRPNRANLFVQCLLFKRRPSGEYRLMIQPPYANITLWIAIGFCIAQTGIFSGLNLAIFSVSRLRLEVEATGGNGDAAKLLRLRANSNFALATILWGNVATNVLLTLFSEFGLGWRGRFRILDRRHHVSR